MERTPVKMIFVGELKATCENGRIFAGLEGHRKISLSPQSKALKVSGTRGSLNKTAARVVSRYRQSRVLNRQKKDNTTFGINCRCQPKCVVNIIKEFDDRKKELIGEVGFDGLLDIKLTKVNRQFGAWLLSKVDPKSCAIVKDVNQELPFGPNDVNAVFGLPCSGQPIIPCSQDELDGKKQILCEIFEIPNFSHMKISLLERILKKQYGYPMTIDEKRVFMAAFVLYVTTKLLAPQSCANFISPRYIMVVSDVDNIKQYNWSQFVVDEVKKAAESMPTYFPNKAQLSINGCIIFLMVKYLRNLQFRKVGITCVKTCHISQFEDDQIARMIQQDVVSKHNPGFPFPRYGKLQLMKEPRENNPHVPELSPLNLCSGSKIPSRAIDGGKNLIKFLESHFSSLDVRGTVGSQAYEELKSYVQDGFDRIDEILPTISDFVDISTMQTAIHASDLFKRAFKTNITAAVKIAIRAAVMKVIDTIEDIQGPLHPWGDTTAMGYHTPTNYSTHATKDASQLDQPTEFGSDGQKKRKYTVENPPSHLLKHMSKRVVKPNRKLMSPFMSKQCSTERLESRIADDLYSYIMSISDDASLEKTWLQSSHPFRISLTLRNIQETIKIGSQMDSDSLNLAIRIMFQQEVERFHNTNYLGWRHFINQDFGMYALAGEEFWEASHQLAHFSGPEVVYDVSESHLILIPVHLFNHYVLYVFNMESKKLSVLDSLNTEDPLGESRFTRHDKIKIMVSQCVMECMRLASPGWNMDILNWDFETVENIPEQQNGDDCGFYVFNFMVNYDGRRLLNPITEDPYYLRRQFLIHLLTLRDNEAILPEYVVDRLRQIKDN
ncbi:Os01g0295000 [Oryza sativa Japonica Group]|uniref:Os01g0295000 protein n=1 Tax=Oryza sativa subsp. japonica TaxID=39947 RepID=A0A0P0V1F8_ORYSJ|nr:Os01g0295000 [Oryza sativa Japonica Group]